MKKLIFILVPVIVIGGVVGAALMGVINIPGLTPKKKPGAGLYGEAADMYAEQKDPPKPKPRSTPPPAPPVAAEPRSTTDPERGAKRLARLWNDLPTERLVPMVSSWRDPELALVLKSMDSEAASRLLAALEPARASRLSREIQRLASVVPPG